MGNQLRSPTSIGHLSLSDNSTDDYLYINGVPITGGGTPSNMMTTNTDQDVTGAKTFVDEDNFCKIAAANIHIETNFSDSSIEHYCGSDLRCDGLDLTHRITGLIAEGEAEKTNLASIQANRLELSIEGRVAGETVETRKTEMFPSIISFSSEAGETTERYKTTEISAGQIYFSISSSDSPSPDEESYLRFPVGRDREILATQNDIKKYYRHYITLSWQSDPEGETSYEVLAYITLYNSNSNEAETIDDIGELLQLEYGGPVIYLPASVYDNEVAAQIVTTIQFSKTTPSSVDVEYYPPNSGPTTITISTISDYVKEI